jgi:glc operon protein GlcG
VVVDSGGHVITGARMDGMPFGTFDVARGKAIASVATGGESGKALMERYKANPIVFGQISSLSYGGPMFPSQGSLPIFINGLLVGAAAGSGASSQFDEDAVRAGIAAIGASSIRP